MVYQNGKLIQKKQPLYADEVERLKKQLDYDANPAPGSYSTENYKAIISSVHSNSPKNHSPTSKVSLSNPINFTENNSSVFFLYKIF